MYPDDRLAMSPVAHSPKLVHVQVTNELVIPVELLYAEVLAH